MERRDLLKAMALGATTAGVAAGDTATAGAADEAVQAKNPYGGVPGGGITFPPYYRPTPYLVSNNIYYPGQEPIGPDEMRISFIGSTPIPVTRAQAGTCIMVELGNGKRFFFDFGSGCMRNIIAMAVPLQTVNEFSSPISMSITTRTFPTSSPSRRGWGAGSRCACMGRRAGRPKDGIKHMIEGMKMMTHWHTDFFNACPIGDGYEVEVNEFDFRDDNGVCYDKDGVDHPPLAAVAHQGRRLGLPARLERAVVRLDGDGRPDELSLELAKGVDVFVTEVQPDTANLQALKFGMPPIVMNTTIDQAHSPHYAVGYMFNKIQPRLAMVTHMSYDEELIPEIVAGIRVHYSGLFQFGAPDVVVVNVTKDADLDAQGCDSRRRQHGSPKPERRRRTVRPEPDESEGQIPQSPAYGCRHPGARTSAIGRSTRRSTTRPTCIASRSAISRTDFKIDVRQMALMKVKQTRPSSRETGAKLQASHRQLEGK